MFIADKPQVHKILPVSFPPLTPNNIDTAAINKKLEAYYKI